MTTEAAARFWAVDEARFGLKAIYRRRWCPRGRRPPWIVDDRYEWLWLYVAVEPKTGASFTLELPRLDTDCVQVFVSEFRKHHPTGQHVFVWDGAPAHRSGRVEWPPGLEPLQLPPYSPELDPVERLFEVLRGEMANRAFEGLEAMREGLTEAQRPYWDRPERLARLTGYPWWIEATGSILTS